MCVGKMVPRALCHWSHLGRFIPIPIPRSCICSHLSIKRCQHSPADSCMALHCPSKDRRQRDPDTCSSWWASLSRCLTSVPLPCSIPTARWRQKRLTVLHSSILTHSSGGCFPPSFPLWALTHAAVEKKRQTASSINDYRCWIAFLWLLWTARECLLFGNRGTV